MRAMLRTAPLRLALALTLVLAFLPLALAEAAHVDGVTNFGKVTELYFRGGKVTTEGVKNLYDMGVRTIIDLTGDRKEKAVAERLGMKFYSFPMEGSERPSDEKVAKILKIISEADQPVYAHCAAGKHRAGTIAALYRIRVQGWEPDKAWKEQASYGFGSPSGHRKLYAYVYGDRESSHSKKKKKSHGHHDRKHHDDD